MFPMVSTVDEFVQARRHFDREVDRAKRLGLDLPHKIEVGDRYDPLHPASLSILKFIAHGCAKNNKVAAVCGAMASRPIEAITLIALGYDNLSMPVTGIGPVKSAVLALDAGKLKARLDPLITLQSRLSTVGKFLHFHNPHHLAALQLGLSGSKWRPQGC